MSLADSVPQIGAARLTHIALTDFADDVYARAFLGRELAMNDSGFVNRGIDSSSGLLVELELSIQDSGIIIQHW